MKPPRADGPNTGRPGTSSLPRSSRSSAAVFVLEVMKKLLLQSFGQAYEEYCRHPRRFRPGID
jgi:hypothetical protein